MFSSTAFSDLTAVKNELAGPFIIIKNALDKTKAEELYTVLKNYENWHKEDESIFDGKTPANYSYKRLSVDMTDRTAPQPVKLLHRYLNSRDVLDLIEKISNRKCDQFTGRAVAYREGHYIKSHNDLHTKKTGDQQIITRAVTFNYFLTKDWRQEWGGQFIWENPLTRINPSFNTLVMFLVGPDSHHHVTPIISSGNNTRLAITGWFTTNRELEKNPHKLNLDFL